MIGDDFTQMIREVSETECTASQYMGIIILLYKKGIREMIENWRPITLLNCDYKILEKVFANRLKHVISKIIKEDQKAYVKNRYIGDNARLMEDIIFECESNETDGAIILIDQSKAYDRVEKEWLKKVMERFNFGTKFINWIMMLYKNAVSSIMTNGHFSETININRGLRQGSPLSSLLYIIQAEPLAEMIRHTKEVKGISIEGREVKMTAYADDTQFYISNKQSKTELEKILNLYSQASGAKINDEKTEGILLNNMPKIDGIEWKRGPVKALGVPQGHVEDLCQFWDRILQKVRKRLELWTKRYLTLKGKVYVIKSMAISTVTYVAGLKVTPEKKLKEIEIELWKYLWDGKTEAVKREICMNKVEDGGLGMPSLRNIVRTRQIMLIQRVMSEGDHTWKLLPRKYFKTLDAEYGENYFLLNAVVPHEIIDSLSIPEFYKQCIKSWQEVQKQHKVTKSKEAILKERLWFNPKLKVNENMLENKAFAKAGIHTVADVLNDKGILRHEHVKSKIDNRDITLYMNKIIAAIPKNWREILTNEKETVDNGNQKTVEKYAMNAKQVYLLIHQKKEKTRWEKQWEDMYGSQDWNRIYKSLKNKLADRKSIDTHWKSLTFGLNTEEKLKKMKLSNGMCTSCTVEIENVEHLFYGCEILDRTWISINKLCQTIWKVNINNDKMIILSNCEEESNAICEVVEYIIMCVKWVLWKRRNLIKYDDKWYSDTETEKWVLNYIRERTELIVKTTLKKDIQTELEKILSSLKSRP